MLKVTDRATEQLKEILDAHATEAEQALRLSPGPQGELVLTLDSERDGDQVIASAETKVLLVGEELATPLEGATIDFQDTPEGPQLVLTREGAPGAPQP